MLYKLQVEGAALTADLWICYCGRMNCSAEVHEEVIPSDLPFDARIRYENPMINARSLFSPAAATINVAGSPVN